MPYDIGRTAGVVFTPATERAALAAQSALARDDDRKGALTVRALLQGLTDEEAFLRVLDHGKVTTLNSIRWYRSALRLLGYDNPNADLPAMSTIIDRHTRAHRQGDEMCAA
jgi:hypothetical protein